MKRLFIIIAIALLAAGVRASTNTNFVATSSAVQVGTNDVLQTPTNFAAANAFLISSNVSIAYSNSFSWTPSASGGVLQLNTNYVDPVLLTNYVALGRDILGTNLVVTFSTNVLRISSSAIVINSATGRTVDATVYDPTLNVTNTLKFVKGFLVEP